MNDFFKAFIQKKIGDFNIFKSSAEERLGSLENFEKSMEDSNMAGETTVFEGSVEVKENIDILGYSKISGDDVATENYVDDKTAFSAKTNENNNFTAAQRAQIIYFPDDTISWDFRSGNNYDLTLTSSNSITLSTDGTLDCIGQGGIITVHNAEYIDGWGIEFNWKNVPDDLQGTERIGYFIEAQDIIAMGIIR